MAYGDTFVSRVATEPAPMIAPLAHGDAGRQHRVHEEGHPDRRKRQEVPIHGAQPSRWADTVATRIRSRPDRRRGAHGIEARNEHLGHHNAYTDRPGHERGHDPHAAARRTKPSRDAIGFGTRAPEHAYAAIDRHLRMSPSFASGPGRPSVDGGSLVDDVQAVLKRAKALGTTITGP